MENLKKYMKESLLGGFDDIEKNQNKDLVNQWCKDNLKGDYKAVVLKSNKLKLRGDIILKEYSGDSFPYPITELHGNLAIEKCKNITSLEGLFDDVMRLDGNLSVNNCPKLTSLKGCPFIVSGTLSIVGNSSLKSLEGISEMVGGSLYWMKNGKKFKEEQIKKAMGGGLTTRIVCSEESNNNLINEELINEALNEPHLLELVDQLELHKLKFDVLFRSYNVRWDKLDSSNIREYDKIDSKAKTIIRNIIANRGNNTYGIILLRDYDGNYTTAISYNKQYTHLDPNLVLRSSRWGRWTDAKSTELIEMVERAHSAVVITWTSQETQELRDLRRNRWETKDGMVKNTPEYYAQVARENMKRYKAIIEKRRASGYKGEFDKIDKEVEELTDKSFKTIQNYRKNFKSGLRSIYSSNHEAKKIEETSKLMTNMIQSYGSYSKYFIEFKEAYESHPNDVGYFNMYKNAADNALKKLKEIMEELKNILK